MQHLYHTNIKRNENLYLEKVKNQDYVSKFLSYDKHTTKKKVFFYYNLIRLKISTKKKPTKFSFSSKSEKRVATFLDLPKIFKSCHIYSFPLISKYTPFLHLGINSHNDPYKGYKKGVGTK